MFLKKRKSLITLLIALFAAVVLALGALTFTSGQTAYAYKSSNMPTGTNAIGNIYKGNGKFDKGNLDKLAQSIKNGDGSSKYSNINYLIRFAELNGTVTSADFGDIVVNFGSYTFNGASRELTWIPAYISKDNSGNAILTLWLANTADNNGSLSNQEVSTWSDGTYSTSTTQGYNGSTIYSNTYDGSYIRNYVLNGSENYAKQWGNGTAITLPDSSTMTKFSQFVGSGALASYIVKPSAVSWQMNEKKMKNDVGWYCTNLGDPGFNYPSKWTNDNLWLPSMYEVYDNTIADNCIANSFSVNGGLWQTGDSSNKQKRSNSKNSWLRSGYYGQCSTSYVIPSDGSKSYNDNAYAECAVRPALHLNLKKAAEAATPATCEFPSGWKNSVSNSADLTEITFAKTAPDGYSDSGKTLNTDIKIYTKDGDNTKIAFVYDGTITAPQNSSYLFYNLQNLTTINFDNFSTDNVKNMSSMFEDCSGLTSLGLSGFNTENVMKMEYMFYGCSELTSLDLSGFNTENVINMDSMFNGCSNLKTIKVSSSLATKLSTTDGTWLYYGVMATWYGEDGTAYTDSNRFSAAGTYTTVQPPFEVTVGNNKTYYNTLPGAWNYANTQPFATVKMLADAEVAATLTVVSGKNITLDLNGYKLEYTGDSGSVIQVNGMFTLEDNKNNSNYNPDPSHTITSPVTNKEVTIKGGLITGGKGSGNSVLGGAIYVDGGSFTMNGGTLAGNKAGFGGAVRVGNGKDSNATFIMNSDATISHNKATKDGGGICVCGATKVELKGTISDNAAVAGGGIYYEHAGNHTISGATIKNNVVKKDSDVDYSGNGGGIYVDDSTVTMSGGTISGNSTAKNGGGVYVLDGSTFEMENGTISGNMAGSDNYGGGVYVIGTFIMLDGAISGNKAQDGGGVCVNVGGTFTMSGGTIKGNNATIYHGGGVELTDCTFNVSGSAVIKDNVKGGSLDESTGLYTGGTKDNVYLAGGERIIVTGALTTGAIIGVYNSGEIAMGYNQSENPSVFFKADDADCCATALDGAVFIALHKGGKATCTAKKVCTNCGESYGEVDSTNHTPNADDGDCTTAITCSDCGTVTTAAQTSHDFSGNYETSSTQHWHVCQHDGCTQTDTKTDHNCNLMRATPTYLAAGPTCTQGASYYYSCVCGAAGTDTFRTVGGLGHDWGEWTESKAATCTGKGEETRVCSRDNTHKETRAIDELGHDWESEFTVDKQPTCTEKGSKSKHCSRCGEKSEVTEIEMIAHTEEEIPAVAATCTAKGKTAGKKCSVCNTVITAQTEVAALGHDYATEFTVDKQPTVSEKGSKSKHCSRCEEKTEITEIDMLKAELVKPDENGGEVDEVVVSIPSGFTPDIELVVTEIEKENYGSYEAIANTVNGEINLVYDVTLKSDGVTIQPDGMLTIKLRIPENLVGKNFKLFHLHGSEATDMEYAVDGNYAVVNTDKLSEFIFVGDKTAVAPTPDGFNPLWLILIIIVSLVIVGEVGYIVYRKVRKNKAGEMQE